MTTYNTGNPIGSTSPKDLYDNAQNFDELVNNLDEEFYPDRLGVERKTWHGIEKEFNEFMQSAGFVTIGNYAGGIEITAYNQVLVDSSGVQWRLNPETPLPYTTTGAGLPEGNNFINMGDLVYRSELGSAAYLDAGSAAEALATNLQVFTIIRSLGLNSTLVPMDGQDLDATTVPTGFYSVNFADLWENNPFGAQPDLAIFNLLKSENTAFQLAMSMSSNEVAWRSADASTTFGSWSYLPSVLQTTGDSTTSAMSQKAVTDSLTLKIDKTAIKQTTGSSTADLMSQKAVSDELLKVFGVGQTIQSVTRVINTEYTNTTSKTIFLSASYPGAAGDPTSISVDGSTFCSGTGTATGHQLVAVIPAGSKYTIFGRIPNVTKEYR